LGARMIPEKGGDQDQKTVGGGGHQGTTEKIPIGGSNNLDGLPPRNIRSGKPSSR